MFDELALAMLADDSLADGCLDVLDALETNAATQPPPDHAAELLCYMDGMALYDTDSLAFLDTPTAGGRLGALGLAAPSEPFFVYKDPSDEERDKENTPLATRARRRSPAGRRPLGRYDENELENYAPTTKPKARVALGARPAAAVAVPAATPVRLKARRMPLQELHDYPVLTPERMLKLEDQPAAGGLHTPEPSRQRRRQTAPAGASKTTSFVVRPRGRGRREVAKPITLLR
ncbi:uncharacterized protein V1510DRAFT_415344 [Dipodascopsis tothii]|uniref:uncharacterized protein n=1 Tax=Dipodascopsis tothii TaxID=44089 RepID=UPI0034CF7C02